MHARTHAHTRTYPIDDGDAEPFIIHTNARTTSMFGYEAEELHGRGMSWVDQNLFGLRDAPPSQRFVHIAPAMLYMYLTPVINNTGYETGAWARQC